MSLGSLLPLLIPFAANMHACFLVRLWQASAAVLVLSFSDIKESISAK